MAVAYHVPPCELTHPIAAKGSWSIVIQRVASPMDNWTPSTPLAAHDSTEEDWLDVGGVSSVSMNLSPPNTRE